MKKRIFIILALLFITTRAFSQKEHFGLILGSSYNVEEIGREFRSHYGNSADCGGYGDFYQVRLYSTSNKEGASFGNCTLDFYKGRLWKVYYENIQQNPNDFANRLERKYGNYSISDTRYEYQYGNINIDFDGDRLLYVNESVSKSMIGY